MKLSLNMKSSSILIAGLAVLVCGCQPEDPPVESTGVSPIRMDNPKFAAEAGIDAQVDADPKHAVQEVAKSKYFATRSNAFAVLGTERTFDRSQLAARLVSEGGGGFGTYYVEPQPSAADAPPVLEPLPAWRLSGVVISDGVAALLEMGPGKVIDIRPGQKIPDTEWTVVSIDSERAVLRRGGNKLPKTFIVPLQGPMGVGGAGGGGTGGAGGPGKKGGPAGGGGDVGTG